MSWLEKLLGPPASWDQAFLVVVASYLVGCLAGGYYLVRWWLGKDLRTLGSGTVGARNVSSVLGAPGFLATLLWDVLKGGLVVWAVRRWNGDERLIALALLAVVVGHIWPVQLRFHGGKGVGTSLGGLLIYDWSLVIAYGLAFLLPFALTRRTMLPGLIAFACLPLASLLLQHDPIKLGAVSFLVALVLIAHRRNILAEFEALGHTEDPEARVNKS